MIFFCRLAIEAIKEAEDRLQKITSSQDPHRRLSIMETLLSTDGLTRSDVATIILDLLLTGIETVRFQRCKFYMATLPYVMSGNTALNLCTLLVRYPTKHALVCSPFTHTALRPDVRSLSSLSTG
jgi:hypothetical protein